MTSIQSTDLYIIISTLYIFLVALMLYYIYRLMKESRSLNVFYGIIVFVLIWLFVSQVLEMKLLGSILSQLASVGVIGLIVLFKEEIRKFLYQLGAHQRVKSVMRFFSQRKDNGQDEDKETIMPIVWACMDMAKKKVGAWQRKRSVPSLSSSGPHRSTTSCKPASRSTRASTNC